MEVFLKRKKWVKNMDSMKFFVNVKVNEGEKVLPLNFVIRQDDKSFGLYASKSDHFNILKDFGIKDIPKGAGEVFEFQKQINSKTQMPALGITGQSNLPDIPIEVLQIFSSKLSNELESLGQTVRAITILGGEPAQQSKNWQEFYQNMIAELAEGNFT